MQEFPEPVHERKARREKKVIVLAVALSLLLVGLCFALPYLFSEREGPRSRDAGSATTSQDGERDLEDILLGDNTFTEASDILESNYVDEVSGDDLLRAAARGIRRLEAEGASNEALVERGITAMVDSLDDPFSSYMDPEELASLDATLSGRFSGVGVALERVKYEIRVVEVLDGTPAMEAGIQEGDIIREVDGRDVKELELEEAVTLIRGPEGTTVKLGIVRPPSSSVIDFDIVRRSIEVPVVESEMKANGTGYMRMSDWTQNVDSRVAEVLGDLRDQGAKSLVIDLRSNPGGYLDPAVKAADLFLRDGVIVTSKGRVAGYSDEYTADGAVEWDLPVVVLVNRGTASSSEIFAAALRDNGRCILVGETTFGKGSIQKIFRQADGSGLRLTIARYYTPSGVSIDDEGIKPDMTVKNPVVGEEDAQLQRALEEAAASHL